MDSPIYIENKFHMFEKSILLYIFSKKKALVCDLCKTVTVILVKCSFRHNTSPASSKNCWDGRGWQYNDFRAFEPHSYTQREFFFSKLHRSLSDRIIIGLKVGQNFRFVKKNSGTCDTKLSLHWKVSLRMLYRLINLYRK